jgi:hypothetical protein
MLHTKCYVICGQGLIFIIKDHEIHLVPNVGVQVVPKGGFPIQETLLEYV